MSGQPFLYEGTGYAAAERPVAPSMPTGSPDAPPSVLKQPVWTWEVPLYFWLGGVTAGSAWAGAALEAAGDRPSAAVARRVTLGAVALCPPLLIGDLGRPERFLNMVRVFRPRSPMSMGAWCLTAFSVVAGGAVAADSAGRRGLARALGYGAAGLGTYLGSYAGALLSSTAVPAWSRNRLLLGPLFAASAAATGASAVGLALTASGGRNGTPGAALHRVAGGALVVELVLSAAAERRAGAPARGVAPLRAARVASAAALVAGRLGRARRRGRPARASAALTLAGGLALRYGWLATGRASAREFRAR